MQNLFDEEEMNQFAWAFNIALFLICCVTWTSVKPKPFLDFYSPLVWNKGLGDLVSLRIFPALASIECSGEKARLCMFNDHIRPVLW